MTGASLTACAGWEAIFQSPGTPHDSSVIDCLCRLGGHVGKPSTQPRQGTWPVMLVLQGNPITEQSSHVRQELSSCPHHRAIFTREARTIILSLITLCTLVVAMPCPARHFHCPSGNVQS